MTNSLRKTTCAPLVITVALLVGCTQGPFDNPPLGDATKQNFAVQIIDPRPAPTALAPDLDGNVAASAIQRYKTGAITAPIPESVGN